MPRLSKIGAAALAAFGWTSGSSVTASYLVVAGGGGGGSAWTGGGGGAGGMQTGTLSLNPTLSYTVTVGSGGAAATSGSNSVFSTVTSIGGGNGVTDNSSSPGGNGGSGGGNGYNVTTAGGSGTSGQGNNGGGGSGWDGGAGTVAGGGGGGKSAAGATAAFNSGGAGGAGAASSISGSSVTYAGGGGGGSGGGSAGAGGAGGGGAGALGSNASGTAGTVNTGGGGGGAAKTSGTGGTGGSGVVIISYVGAQQFGGGFVTSSGGNTIHTFTTSGTLSPLSSLTAQYLVVGGGGGGGGGGGFGGGGGAGGFLSTTGVTIDTNSNYVVTVGAGGAASTGGNGGSGTLSSFLTLTAAGGGYGGGFNTVGASGGSGGGGGESQNGGSGNTPSTTPSQGSNGGKGSTTSNGGGGGGGGASAVGGSPTNSSGGGAGGAGSASSISGTSTYYAGGGGGCTATTPAPAGGTGGGGNGSFLNNIPAVAGTANTGGGGGGGYLAATYTGAAGGSGVVIIAYPGSTQQMAGGTVTISGGNVIHTFTSSGYLTPIKYASRSLRFRSSASAYISRTPTATTNRRTWTWSSWVKRGALGSVTRLFSADNGAQQTLLRFQADNTLQFQIYNSGVAAQIITTQVFRDPSAWYHIVAVMNTTDATSANRMVLYINGVQVTALSTASYPSQNYDAFVNQTILHSTSSAGTSEYWDGYLAEVNFVDGAALTPSSFGTFNSYGVWQPITYGGSYGTNGFYLTFGNNTSTTTLGYDTSPQGNNWTTNNISVTAGTTYDSMTDVPTLTSATAANWCTWNPLLKGSDVSTASGNLEASWSGVNGHCIMATMTLPQTGKWKCEITGVYQVNFGITPIATQKVTEGIGTTVGYGYRGTDGQKVINGSYSAYGATYGTSDVITLLYNADTLVLEFKKNNISQGTISVASDIYVVGVGYQSPSAGTAKINFGQQSFTYTDSGFVALNTYNLSTPTIPNGATQFAATLYTGTGAALTVANTVNGTSFQPDFVWIKKRSAVASHTLFDTNRGATIYLSTDSTSAEATAVNSLTAFNSNGFTLGNGSGVNTNDSAATYIAWQWKANGTGVSNTSGSITSTVSANTTAGFSVVTYTGTGANATVGHGLGVAPSFIIVKERSAVSSWMIALDSSGFTWSSDYYQFDSGAKYTNAAGTIFRQAPTSTVFSAGTNSNINASANTFVAYCFAAIAGYSAFGSYTGNGSADGPFVYLGFRPRFVIIKRTDTTNNWHSYNSSSDPSNIVVKTIYPNLSNAEATENDLDFVSNGMKMRDTGTHTNASGGTYIYMAWAENPFNYSNAR